MSRAWKPPPPPTRGGLPPFPPTVNSCFDATTGTRDCPRFIAPLRTSGSARLETASAAVCAGAVESPDANGIDCATEAPPSPPSSPSSSRLRPKFASSSYKCRSAEGRSGIEGPLWRAGPTPAVFSSSDDQSLSSFPAEGAEVLTSLLICRARLEGLEADLGVVGVEAHAAKSSRGGSGSSMASSSMESRWSSTKVGGSSSSSELNPKSSSASLVAAPPPLP
mmetsp:Transcript_9494/g.26881  ORF Transcript_9494/g.26881 Transcript_9494/m.26881 type:complete len:222 (-) Transcript_9494:229-894(-)